MMNEQSKGNLNLGSCGRLGKSPPAPLFQRGEVGESLKNKDAAVAGYARELPEERIVSNLFLLMHRLQQGFEGPSPEERGAPRGSAGKESRN